MTRTITVETMDGESFPLSVASDCSVAQLKSELAELTSIPPYAQRLLYNGKLLDSKLPDFSDEALYPDAAHFIVLIPVDSVEMLHNHNLDNPSQPGPRVGHTMVRTSARTCLLFGGVSRKQYTNDLYEYDLESNTWTMIPHASLGGPHIAEPRSDHCAVWYGDQMIVWGGRSTNEWFTRVHVFRPETRQWIVPAITGPAPVPRARFAYTVCRNMMLIYGGYGPNFELLNDLWGLNLDTMTWVFLGRGPVPIAGMSMNVINGDDGIEQVYCFGGLSAQFSNAVYRLDTTSWRWQLLETKGMQPTPRGCHVATTIDKKLLVFGGFSHQARFASWHVLDVRTGEWARPRVVTADGELAEVHGRSSAAAVRLGRRRWLVVGGENGTVVFPDALIVDLHLES